MAEIKDKIVTVESLSALYNSMIYQAGDSIDISGVFVGHVTNGTSVTFTVPVTKPIIGSPYASVTNDGGLILRQNGEYTHGSDGDSAVYVSPELYIIDNNYNNGFVITTVFTDDIDTTNIIDNDVAIVNWSGTIVLS